MKTIFTRWRGLLRQVRLFPFAAFLTALPLSAQVPSLINYQGRLTDAQGNPVTGNRTMAVRIYDAPSGGNMTYEETIGTVAVTNGTYSFQFGDEGDGIIGVLIGFSDYLALSVNGTEETTRTRLLAVPYALKAKESEDAQALVQQLGELEAQTTEFATNMEAVAANLSANLTAAQEQAQSVNATVAGLLEEFKVIGLSGSLAFGNSTNSGTLEISNSGFGRLTVTGIEYPPGFSGDWNGGIIKQGSSAWVNVTFTPTVVQTYSGNIVVTSDATSGSGAIPVSGEGARSVALNGDLAFGNATVNAPTQRSYTIANPGSMDLTVSGITYPAGFSGNWSGTIAPGSSQSVTAIFIPTAVQAYGGNLSVISNASAGNGVMAVSGVGVDSGTAIADMVTVQGGTLPQSSELAGQTIATFEIGKYEVTWGEWKDVRDWAAANGYSDLAGVGDTYPSGSADNFPVINVNWYDVLKYCNARSEKEGLVPVYQVSGAVYKTGKSVPTVNSSANGYRLPTEAEWEWAARGGVCSQGYTYSGSNDVNAVAWYYDNSSEGTKAVGTKAANELAIHDMSGNVSEWGWDFIGQFRGGSFLSHESGFSVYSRYAGIHGTIYATTTYFPNVGFRLARNLDD